MPTQRHLRHQFGGKGRLTSPPDSYLQHLSQAVAMIPRLPGSLSAIRNSPKLDTKKRREMPRKGKSDGGDRLGEEAAPSPRKTWGPQATAETVGAQPRERENELRRPPPPPQERKNIPRPPTAPARAAPAPRATPASGVRLTQPSRPRPHSRSPSGRTRRRL